MVRLAEVFTFILLIICQLHCYGRSPGSNADTGTFLSYRILEPSEGPAGLYEKLEVGVRLPLSISNETDRFFADPLFTRGLNPYDPDSLDVYALFTSPSGRQFRVNAFFYREYSVDTCIVKRKIPCWHEESTVYPWRIRFAASETGIWRFSVYCKVSGTEYPAATPREFSFSCVSSPNRGFLATDGRNLLFPSTREVFPVIGMNTDWYRWGYVNPSISGKYRQMFHELSIHGANTASLAMINRTGLQIEWEHLGVYEFPAAPVNSEEYLANRQAHAWEIDRIFDFAEECGIYLKFNLLQHADFGPDFWNWPENPYHRFIPSVINPEDFFSDQTARRYFLKKLRYIVARWGYSTQIAWFELVTEIDNISRNAGGDAMVLDWFEQMAAALKEYDYANHLISASYATHYSGNDPSSWVWLSPFCGMINLHHYGENKRTNFDRFAALNKVKSKVPGKPIIFGEMGGYDEPVVDAATPLQFHNNLWATFMMDGVGTGLYWHWETIRSKGYLVNFKPLSEFAGMIDRRLPSEGRRFPLFHGLTFRGRNYRVESYYRVATNKQSAYGWVMNATGYWFNQGLQEVYNQSGRQVEPVDDDKWQLASIRNNDFTRIAGLKRSSWYCLALFLIEDESLRKEREFSIRTNIFGQADFLTGEFFSQSNDFAYIIRPGKCDCNVK